MICLSCHVHHHVLLCHHKHITRGEAHGMTPGACEEAICILCGKSGQCVRRAWLFQARWWPFFQHSSIMLVWLPSWTWTPPQEEALRQYGTRTVTTIQTSFSVTHPTALLSRWISRWHTHTFGGDYLATCLQSVWFCGQEKRNREALKIKQWAATKLEGNITIPMVHKHFGLWGSEVLRPWMNMKKLSTNGWQISNWLEKKTTRKNCKNVTLQSWTESWRRF